MYTTAKDTMANDTKNDVKMAAGAVRDNIESVANKAGRTVREYIDVASEEISHATGAVTSQIRGNPVQSSLMALAAGFVLGALFRR